MSVTSSVKFIVPPHPLFSIVGDDEPLTDAESDAVVSDNEAGQLSGLDEGALTVGVSPASPDGVNVNVVDDDPASPAPASVDSDDDWDDTRLDLKLLAPMFVGLPDFV